MKQVGQNSISFGDGESDSIKKIEISVGENDKPAISYDPAKKAWSISNGIDQAILFESPNNQATSISDKSGPIEIDLSLDTTFLLTLEGDAAISFKNPSRNKNYILSIVNSSGGNHTVALPNSMKFQGLRPNLKFPSQFVPLMELHFTLMSDYFSSSFRQFTI